MRDHMLSARRLGLSLTTTLFFLALASPTAAQTTSVTLYGIVYPTNDVVFEDGLYTYGIPTYLWIGNDPQITILGTGADGQTTFGYYDIYTQSQNDVGLTTLITESGIMVQDSAGLYYDGTFAVETCKFALEATAGAAECVLPFFSPPFTVTGTITPFFTYIETLQTPPPTSTPTPSSANTSGTTQGSPTGTSSGPFPPKHKVPTGPIVGGILGGLAVIVGILAFLFWRRRQRHGDSMREKDEFDPEPAGAIHHAVKLTPFVYREAESDQRLPFGVHPAGTSTAAAMTAESLTSASSLPETRRDRRRRLKQMEDTVQQLQRNISVADPAPETEGTLQQRQIEVQRQMDVLLGEVERLRATVARDDALPAYER